ncbi:MAG: hypothetical protein K8S00_08900 [Bacteroidales bacterium]|nr:hypothetical protein [Bacteroidales bacterium]
METFQIIEGSILHLLEVLVLSGIKFIFAPALSMGLGFSYFQTIIYTSLGGVAGVYFFYYLSGWIISFYYKQMDVYVQKTKKLKLAYLKHKNKSYPPQIKKSFTFRNKVIVRARLSFGIKGIAILTPVLLSIPLGAFLLNKYYGHNKKKFIYLSISIFIWSFVVSSLLFIFRHSGTLPLN